MNLYDNKIIITIKSRNPAPQKTIVNSKLCFNGNSADRRQISKKTAALW